LQGEEVSEKEERRSWTPEAKTEIVFAMLRGDRSVLDVYREHWISERLSYQSRDRLL
jgi:transposase-like protein